MNKYADESHFDVFGKRADESVLLCSGVLASCHVTTNVPSEDIDST